MILYRASRALNHPRFYSNFHALLRKIVTHWNSIPLKDFQNKQTRKYAPLTSNAFPDVFELTALQQRGEALI